MKKKTISRMITLNAIIILVNILLFSNAFFHIDLFGSNVLLSAFGATVIIMSIIVFGYGNYKLLNAREDVLLLENTKTLDDCLVIIKQNRNVKAFAGNLETVVNQIKMFQKKAASIKDILLQKFSDSEMSYSSFHAAITDLEKVMYLNIKSILNRISAFDDEEYEQIIKHKTSSPRPSRSMQEKLEIFNEYFAFVDHAAEDNEQIILKLDKLLLEISKFNSLEQGEIEDMNAMKEIDALIHNAKWYK